MTKEQIGQLANICAEKYGTRTGNLMSIDPLSDEYNDLLNILCEDYDIVKKGKPTKQNVSYNGWVTRLNNGYLGLYFTAPWGMPDIRLPKEAFPNLKWDNEPIKIRMIVEEI